jgi:hypothetical protein
LRKGGLVLLVVRFMLPGVGHCEVNVMMQGYDNARTGQNLAETTLTTSNVSPATFGKLFTRAVDDEVYAQPLYVSGVDVPGKGTRNVLYVATVNNSVYAFDADDPSAPLPLWHVNLTGKKEGERPVTARDVGQNYARYHDFSNNIGIVGTPVIDAQRQTLYVVARTRKHPSIRDRVAMAVDRVVDQMQAAALKIERPDFAEQLSRNIGSFHRPIIYASTGVLWRLSRAFDQLARAIETGRFVQRLHALDITNGVERPDSPAMINATVSGTGQGSRWGKLDFRPGIQNQRGALLLANDTVYITWAAHCDTGPYHGWIIGYDPTTLAQTVVTSVTPDGQGGGIWQSNSGPSADRSGNIYLTVGNGTATAPKGGRDYGNAFLKLSRAGKVLDWFIPHNYAYLNSVDGDVGAAGVLLIPGTDLLASGGKEGKLYILDRDNFGHFQASSDDQITQTLLLNGPIRATPTYWDGPGGPYVYTWCYSCRGQAFRVRHDRLTVEPASQTGMTSSRGGIASISANGTSAGTGILWVNTGALRAFDASDLRRELWNSEQNTGDDFGDFAKFNTPVVANGKVYLATFSKQVAVFGLKRQENEAPKIRVDLEQPFDANQWPMLKGAVEDHGSPGPSELRVTWLRVSGPGQVNFDLPHEPVTRVHFSKTGEYVIRLSVSDGTLASDADLSLRVTSVAGEGLDEAAPLTCLSPTPKDENIGGTACHVQLRPTPATP